MRRTLTRIVLGTIVVMLAAVAFAPATLLDSWLAMRTGDRLRILGASGFWWRGTGALSSADGGARMPIAWRIAIAPLVQGRLFVRLIDAEGTGPSGTCTIGRDRLDIRDLRARLPAALVAAADPRWTSFALGGSVELDAPSFSLSGASHVGTVHASWQSARIVAGNAVIDLGTVSLAAAPAGDHVAGTIGNTGGDVRIDGTFADRGGVIEVRLDLEPSATASEPVRALLPLLGAANASAGTRVTWRSDR